MRVLFLISLVLGLGAAADRGLALSPAVVLLQHLPLGQTVSVQAAGSPGWTLVNRMDSAVMTDGVLALPARAATHYEAGYEPPPTAAWFQVLPSETLELAAGGQRYFDLQATIPDEPGNYNRHWMLGIDCGPSQTATVGATIRLRARVLFETMPRARQAGEAPCGIAHLAPSVVFMQRQEAGSWQGTSALGNGSTRVGAYDFLPMRAVYAEDLGKAWRFYAQREEAIIEEPWTRCDQMQITLEPGTWQDLHFSASARAIDGPREEVCFFARRAIAENDEGGKSTNRIVGDVAYDHLEVLRIRYLP